MKTTEPTTELRTRNLTPTPDHQRAQLDAETVRVAIPQAAFDAADKYFLPDRRVGFRETQTDRRKFLRPTSELQWRGFYGAVILFAAISTLVILFC